MTSIFELRIIKLADFRCLNAYQVSQEFQQPLLGFVLFIHYSYLIKFHMFFLHKNISCLVLARRKITVYGLVSMQTALQQTRITILSIAMDRVKDRFLDL